MEGEKSANLKWKILIPVGIALAALLLNVGIMVSIIKWQQRDYEVNQGSIEARWKRENMPEDAVRSSIEELKYGAIYFRGIFCRCFLDLVVTSLVSYRIALSKISNQYVDLLAIGLYMYREKHMLSRFVNDLLSFDFVAVAFFVLAAAGLYWAARKKLSFSECVVYGTIMFPLLMYSAFIFASNGKSLIRPSDKKLIEYDGEISGSLRRRILKAAEEYGLTRDDVYVSPRSYLNAWACSGLRFKCIMIFSSLFEALSDDQVMGVVMHELGHINGQHALIRLTLAIVTSLIILAGGAYMFRAMTKRHYDLFLILLLFGNVMDLSDMIADLLFNTLCVQQQEYLADLHACKCKHGRDLIEALRIFEITGSGGLMFDCTKIFNALSSHPATLKRFNAVWDFLAGK